MTTRMRRLSLRRGATSARDVTPQQNATAVDAYAGAPAGRAGNRHLERLIPVPVELPDGRGRAVAQRRTVAAREHGGAGTGNRGPVDVPDRVHAGVHGDEPADPDLMPDRVVGQPDRQQLRPGYVPMLARRQKGHGLPPPRA